MGYTIAIEDVWFTVASSRVEEALAVLRALGLAEGQQGETSSVDALADALVEIGYDVDVSDVYPDGGQCVGITGYIGKACQEDDVLIALAPFAEPDSFVEWRGEDGCRWRHLVRDGALYSQYPSVEWVDDAGNPSTPPELATVVPVQYRDRANHQTAGSIELAGVITPTQIAALRAALHEGRYYVPSQLGLSHLGASAWSSFPTEDDHGWHEMRLDDFEVLRADALAQGMFCGQSDGGGTVADFVARMERAAATGWRPEQPRQ